MSARARQLAQTCAMPARRRRSCTSCCHSSAQPALPLISNPSKVGRCPDSETTFFAASAVVALTPPLFFFQRGGGGVEAPAPPLSTGGTPRRFKFLLDAASLA